MSRTFRVGGWLRALALAATALAATTFEVGAARRGQRPTGWEIRIAPRGEPGTRLILSGRVVSRDRRPLPGATLFVYHADAKGLYAAAGDRTGEPRLGGVLRSGERGEFRIHTVLPGTEAGAPPHLHYEAWGRGITRVAGSIDLEPRAADGPDVPTTTEPRTDRSPDDPSRFSYLPPVESRVRLGAPPGAIVVRPGKDGVLRGSWDLVVGR
jgi:hypothetical protein